MNVKERYNFIMEKYNLKSGIDDLLVMQEYINIWYEHTLDCGDNTVVIYGGGSNTRLLLNYLIDWNEDYKISCIIDNYSDEKELFSIPIIKENELNVKDVKLIWISSWVYRDEMHNRISNTYPNITILDPYETLQSIFSNTTIGDISNYASVNRCKWFSRELIERENTNNGEIKKTISKKLIAGYYSIYDWTSFYREIDIYINNNYEDKKIYINLKKDVDDFLEKIRSRLKDKSSKDCIIFLVDALSKYVAEEMSNLCEWKKGALEFTEYKNEYPTTHEFLLSMFTGWRPFEDMIYVGKKINFSDNKLLKYIRDNNIDIKFMSENCKLMQDFRNINSYHNKLETNSIMSETIFNGICELLESDNSQLIIVHTYDTIHPVHYTPVMKYVEYEEVDDKKLAHKEHFEEAVKYTDELLYFYNQMLDECENITQIVMGDHGINIDIEYCSTIGRCQHINKGAQWDMEILSPELIIKGNWLRPGIDNRLISSNQFVEIIDAVLLNADPRDKITYKDVLPIEIVPGYDKNWIETGINSDNYYLPYGGAGCMNKEYMYLNLEGGEEVYYKINGKVLVLLEGGKDKENVINCLGIESIKDNQFPTDILEDSFFDVHNSLYKKYYND